MISVNLKRKISIIRLGASFVDKTKLVIAYLLFRLKINTPIAVTCTLFNKKFSIILRDQYDFAVFTETFYDLTYDVPTRGEIKNILDLGGHIGDTAIFFHLKYPEARIISIEPDEENFTILEKNTKDISRIIPIQAASGITKGQSITIHKGDRSDGISGTKRSNESVAYEVPCITIEELLKKYKIDKFDLIKFDIEGAEGELFSLTENTKSFRYAVGEVHFDIMKDIDRENFYKNFDHHEITKLSGDESRDNVLIKNNNI